MVQSLSFRRSQVAIGALFCFLGFQYGTWVSRIPALKTHLDLSTGEVGLLLLAPGIGATISFPLVSRLMKGLGSRRLSFVSAFGLLWCSARWRSRRTCRSRSPCSSSTAS